MNMWSSDSKVHPFNPGGLCLRHGQARHPTPANPQNAMSKSCHHLNTKPKRNPAPPSSTHRAWDRDTIATPTAMPISKNPSPCRMARFKKNVMLPSDPKLRRAETDGKAKQPKPGLPPVIVARELPPHHVAEFPKATALSRAAAAGGRHGEQLLVASGLGVTLASWVCRCYALAPGQ